MALLSCFVFLANAQVANAQVANTQAQQPPAQGVDDAAQNLPMLTNTAERDRLMLREVGDSQIFDASVNALSSSQCCNPEQVRASKQASAKATVTPVNTVWQLVQQSRRLRIPDKPQIENYRRQYQREAIWVSRILERATPFVGHIVESLDERYLPVELALLPAIESGYKPTVHSSKKAAGIWQIVPMTAHEAGVPRSSWFDGRSDIIASTQAAIDYLAYLNAEFHGDWLLTLAAYNAGPGRVRGAMARNKKQGLSQNFWSLPLPPETREYVPKFLALVELIRYDSLPGLDIPLLVRGNAFELLDFGDRTSLDKIAEHSGVPESLLKTLNAGLTHGVTPPEGPHYIYVLREHVEQVAIAVSDLDARELYTLPAMHRVVAGDSISTIAQYYGLSQSDLMAMNNLKSSTIRIGQKLAVRYAGDVKNGNIEYVVTIGDTLSDIAKRFSVRMNRILDAQGRSLSSDVIHPGETLSIIVDGEAAG